MKIWYINTFSKGSHHEIYNASILKLCSMCSAEVIAISDKKTLSDYCILADVQGAYIRKRSIFCFGNKNRLFLILSYMWSAILNVLILLFSKSDSVLVYVFNNSLSISVLNKINFLLNRNVIICLHGELELLLRNKQNTKSGMLAKMLGFFVSRYFRGNSYSLKMLLMGDSIKKNLQHLVGKDLNFFVLDHPYACRSTFVNNRVFSADIKLGTVGAMSINKGAEQYLRLLEMMKAEKSHNFQFYAIGKAESDIYGKFVTNNIVFPCGQNCMCPRTLFDKYVDELDYILFFYPLDSYRLTASGAIYDAIAHEIPIISLKNDYFVYLFEKYGRFGYLFDNIDEMFLFIKNDLSANNNLFDFSQIKRKISPQAFFSEFMEIIKK